MRFQRAPAAEAALEIAATLGGFHEDNSYVAVANAALAVGDAQAAKTACDAALRHTYPLKELFTRSLLPMAEATMGCGDLVAAPPLGRRHRCGRSRLAIR